MFIQMYHERYMRFPEGREKALTFSYDDGVLADRKLIEIFDRYGLKGTFNLNNELFGVRSWHNRMDEQETYEKLNSRLPSTGDTVTTPEGLKGEVQSLSVLRQLVKVIVTLENDEKEIREYKASDLRFRPRRKKSDMKLSKEEMKELAALEKNEGASKLDNV